MTGMVESIHNERTRDPICGVGCFLQCRLDRAQLDLLGLLSSEIGPLFSVSEEQENVSISGDW